MFAPTAHQLSQTLQPLREMGESHDVIVHMKKAGFVALMLLQNVALAQRVEGRHLAMFQRWCRGVKK